MKGLDFSGLRSLFGGTDEDLMIRVRDQNDAQAFGTLVKRWEGPIHRLCTRMVGDLARGEDLKQETFARIFAKRSAYQPKARFSTYLWRVALNICHDELRRMNRAQEVFVRPAAAEDGQWEEAMIDAPSPAERAVQAEEGELVRNALLQIPEIYRVVLVLRHYQGLKLSEIAETLEIPLGTVNSRMAEALVRMTRLLEPRLESDAHPRPREILVL